ncbi:MAG: hypothetical protein M3014_04385 [Chloroflexota bacterium]|nr:hypothetical protein [Chloroflexota bacterium]
MPESDPFVLVAHSGAGLLLSAIREVSKRTAACYLSVESGIPRDGMNCLDLFEKSKADGFRASAPGGLLPTLTAHDQEAIPGAELRARFVSELRPLPLAVYEELLPVSAGWPDAPCGHLQFSPFYDADAGLARKTDWAYIKAPGNHFYMLVEPDAVADALIALVGALAHSVEQNNSTRADHKAS